MVLAGGKGQYVARTWRRPPREGQDGFINHAETGRIGFVMYELRTPPVVENLSLIHI